MFWNRQAPAAPELHAKLHELETVVAELRKQFRALRDECHEDMERAERARKAESARNRRAGANEGANQGRGAPSGAPVTPPPQSALPTWGARGRRLMRSAARAGRLEDVSDDNGTDPGEDRNGVSA
jgi:hypothetical protein